MLVPFAMISRNRAHKHLPTKNNINEPRAHRKGMTRVSLGAPGNPVLKGYRTKGQLPCDVNESPLRVVCFKPKVSSIPDVEFPRRICEFKTLAQQMKRQTWPTTRHRLTLEPLAWACKQTLCFSCSTPLKLIGTTKPGEPKKQQHDPTTVKLRRAVQGRWGMPARSRRRRRYSHSSLRLTWDVRVIYVPIKTRGKWRLVRDNPNEKWLRPPS